MQVNQHLTGECPKKVVEMREELLMEEKDQKMQVEEIKLWISLSEKMMNMIKKLWMTTFQTPISLGRQMLKNMEEVFQPQKKEAKDGND